MPASQHVSFLSACTISIRKRPPAAGVRTVRCTLRSLPRHGDASDGERVQETHEAGAEAPHHARSASRPGRTSLPFRRTGVLTSDTGVSCASASAPEVTQRASLCLTLPRRMRSCLPRSTRWPSLGTHSTTSTPRKNGSGGYMRTASSSRRVARTQQARLTLSPAASQVFQACRQSSRQEDAGEG